MAFTCTTQECARLLRTSPRALRRWRREGYLRPGEHFRAIGPGMVHPSLLWDVEKVELALARRSQVVLGG